MTQGAIRITKISPEIFQEMLNRTISVICPVRSMVKYDRFQTTDPIGICCGCVYGYLRFPAVTCS